MVILKNVKMTYPGNKKETLRDIDLVIEDGEFVFLVGPSGSGKSTIMKLLTGEIRPTGGKLVVNGFDLRTIRRHNLPKFRRTLGIIFQDYRLIEDMTVYENVAFAMRVLGKSNREIRKRVPYVLELVDLHDCGDRLPRELSGGEQQRVAVARAIAPRPPILFADEPTAELDSGTGRNVMKLLKDLTEEITVIMTTHDEALAAMADREFMLEDGALL